MVVPEADPASKGLDLNRFRLGRVGNPPRVARPEGRQADIGSACVPTWRNGIVPVACEFGIGKRGPSETLESE